MLRVVAVARRPQLDGGEQADRAEMSGLLVGSEGRSPPGEPLMHAVHQGTPLPDLSGPVPRGQTPHVLASTLTL